MPVRKDHEGRWHVELCIDRRRVHRRLPAHASARDAKALEAQLAADLGQVKASSADPMLADLMAHYIDHHAAHLRSPDTARHHALRIGRWVDGQRASQARQVAARIVQDMRGHYADATINRSLGTLKKALRVAFDAGHIAVDHGAAIRRLAEHNARTTTLTLEEISAIADHASPPTRAAIWLAVYTGCRRGELLGLTRSDIAEDVITVRAGNTKTLRTRTIPIIAPARPWLQAVPIALTAEGLKTNFRRAREAAGRTDVGFHDLRRSCGTLMIRKGVPLHIVSRILGHSTTTVTERVYAHLDDQQLHDGLAVLEGLHRDLHRTKKSAKRKRSASA